MKIDVAITNNNPVINFTSGGGIRVQENIIGLSGMARTTLAVNELKNNNLIYLNEMKNIRFISLTNKTTDIPKNVIKKLNKVSPANKSLDWAMHQKCQDMFVYSKWNGSLSEGSYDIDYDFGTDYGICCWFSPQLNLSRIREDFLSKRRDTNQTLPENWRMGQMDIDGGWFQNIKKGATTGKHNGFTMLVDIELFDYNYSDEGAEGLKVGNINSYYVMFRHFCIYYRKIPYFQYLISLF